MAPWPVLHTLASRSIEDKERLMLRATPEFAAAHQRELADKPPKAGPAAIARYRSERREKRSLFLAAVYRSLPFVDRTRETEAAPSEPKPAT